MSKRLTYQDLLLIANQRNHEIQELSDYKSVKSLITLFCKECSVSWTCTVHAYKAAKNGCPSCKKKAITRTHKKKVTGKETRRLIGEKASSRPGSLTGVFGKDHPRWNGGYNRSFSKPSTMEYCWKQGIKKKFNKKCVVTGEKNNIVCHHLYNWSDYPELRYDFNNGVVLSTAIHLEFHRAYKFGKNTESQFLKFLAENYNLDWSEIKEKHSTWQPSAKLLEQMAKGREEGSETRE